ncbi:MAG: aspartate carbamoyltransferase [Angelakisella sp.]|jgi:aspartate carbamoyltransferase catalytic subunit|nr:aspartate carbamoyltransferase [Angelakisella sp.]
MRHLLSILDLTVEEIDSMISTAQDILDHPERYREACRDKILATLFFEPSTRTRLSFESAMLGLGGRVLGFSDASSSSTRKGESVADTISVVSGYADIIAMRHPKEGAPLVASQHTRVPVINAGDGGHHHPTQTLTDLLTIRRETGRFEDLTIGLCGDLKFGRTVHSLIEAMSRYRGVRFVLISPRELALPPLMVEELAEQGIPCTQCQSLEEQMGALDILYMTRIQRERFSSEEEYQRLKDSYILTPDKLAGAKEGMMILHPLPRVNEIDPRVDDDPRAAYFRQAYYGRYIRMALILHLLGQAEGTAVTPDKGRPRYPQNQLPGAVCGNPHCITTIEQGLEQRFLRDGKTGEYRCLYCESKAE